MALSSLTPPSTATTTHSIPKLCSSHSSLTGTLSFSSKPTTQLLSSNSTSKHWRTNVSFFPAFFTKSKDAKSIKEELLQTIAPLDRGADATPDDQLNIDRIARKLEAVNPTKEPLKSPLLNGKWELIYTTSQSILQTKRPKFLRSRANYQGINADKLRAQNMESFPFFNQVTADLTPLNPKKVAVKFDYFKIGGLIPVKAPDTARGTLEITYLDEDLRPQSCEPSFIQWLMALTAIMERGCPAPIETEFSIPKRVSRGDKGNLFILKMIDPSYQVPA